MFGMGIDIIEISRISGWANDRVLLDSIFTPAEIESISGHISPVKHMASIFAAKEAFMKAAGTGWSSGIGWKDIEIVKDDGGFSIRPHGRAGEFCIDRRVLLTLSTTETLATAMVTIG